MAVTPEKHRYVIEMPQPFWTRSAGYENSRKSDLRDVIAVEAFSIDGVQKRFLWSTNLDIKWSTIEGRARARAFIAQAKQELGMDVFMGRAIEKGKPVGDEIVLSDSSTRLGLFVEENRWLLASLQYMTMEPYFEHGRMPEDEEGFSKLFHRSRVVFPLRKIKLYDDEYYSPKVLPDSVA